MKLFYSVGRTQGCPHSNVLEKSCYIFYWFVRCCQWSSYLACHLETKGWPIEYISSLGLQTVEINCGCWQNYLEKPTLTIHFLVRLTHFKLLMRPVLPRFLLFCLNLSLYWTWKHIHPHNLGTKKRPQCFWYMGYCCLPDLGLLPRVDPFVLQWGKTRHIGHWLYPLLPYWLHLNFDSLSGPSGEGGAECCWYFSGYGVSVPVGSANSGHNIVALETNPCQVFGCLDHLHSDNGVPIITSAQQ